MMRHFALALGVAIAACGSGSEPPQAGGGTTHPPSGGGGGGSDSGTTADGAAQDGGTIGAIVDHLVLDTAAVDGGLVAGPASGAVALVAGSAYVLEVKGTYSIWSSTSWQQPCGGTPEPAPMYASPGGDTGKVGKDAAWIFAWPTAAASLCPNGTPLSAPRAQSLLEVSVDGGATWTRPTPRESTLQSSHEYRFDVVGGGQAVKVRLDEPGQYGELSIDVAKGS